MLYKHQSLLFIAYILIYCLLILFLIPADVITHPIKSSVRPWAMVKKVLLPGQLKVTGYSLLKLE